MRFLSLIVMLGSTGFAQHIAIQVPTEPPATPTSKPETRRRVLAAPASIFNNLLSPVLETRRLAYRQLGKGADDFNTSEYVDDARLIMVNLDDDEELEAILLYTSGRKATTAVVLDKNGDGWWQVGEFEYWWHWNSDEAERLIALKEAVWPGRKDLLVRAVSGGTGVVRTDLILYRMYKGQLYRVFRANEDWEYAAIGQAGIDAYSERHDVALFNTDAAGRPAIVVRHTKTALPSDSSVKPSTEALGCVGYAWNAAKFTFLPDDAITATLCGADAQPAR